MIDRDHLEKTLKNAFEPKHLEVIDESHLHAGHHGHDGSPGTHFKIILVSDIFEGMSRIESHRLVNQKLKDEFEQGLHALVLHLHTSKEYKT